MDVDVAVVEVGDAKGRVVFVVVIGSCLSGVVGSVDVFVVVLTKPFVWQTFSSDEVNSLSSYSLFDCISLQRLFAFVSFIHLGVDILKDIVSVCMKFTYESLP